MYLSRGIALYTTMRLFVIVFTVMFFLPLLSQANVKTFALTDTTFETGSVLRRNIIYGLDGYKGPRAESFPFLDSLVLFLKNHPAMVIEVGTHTDQRGAEKYNRQISALRAAEMVNWLVKHGIPPGQLVDSGYGESRPVYAQAVIDADTSKANKENMYQANRRTEFKILQQRHVLPPAPWGTFTLSDTIFAEGSTFIMQSILYDLNKATLRPESSPFLDSIADFLLKHPYLVVEIGVHTDSRVSDKYSTNLTQRRAERIVDYLAAKGIPRKRLVPKGYLDSKPRRLPDGTVLTEKYILSKPTKEEQEKLHQMNRRTEIRIVRVN